MKFSSIPSVYVALVAFVLFSPDCTADPASKLSLKADGALLRALEKAGQQDEIPVIVGFSGSYGTAALKGVFPSSVLREEQLRHLKAVNESFLGPLRGFLAKKSSGPVHPLWMINGVSLRATPRALAEIASLPAVASIRLDRTVSIPRESAGNPVSAVSPAIPIYKPWNLTMVKAIDLWTDGVTGQGVVVAGVDTGVDMHHPDLGGRWRGGSNSWFDASGEHATPWDSDGHGTRTMGLILGGSSSGNPIGVAPGAQWIAARIYNDAGNTTYTAIHRGFQWVMDPDGNEGTDDAPDIVSNSWGFSDNPGECVTEFQDDIRVLREAGIGVVFSGGNEGPGPASSTSPGNNQGTLSVGSLDELRALQHSSSRGPSPCDGSIFPDLTAPGVNVRTTDLTNNGLNPQSFTYVSGTSFAAPHVTGVMALLLSFYRSLPVSELEAAMKSSAADLGPAGPDNDFGNGLVDSVAAWRRLDWVVRCSDAGPDACTWDAGMDSGGNVDGGGPSTPDGSVQSDAGPDHGGGCSTAGVAGGDGVYFPGLACLAAVLLLARRRVGG